MGRRRGNFVPEQTEAKTEVKTETLSKETPEVKEKLIEEIFENTTTKDIVDEMKKHGAKEIPIKKVEPKKVEFKVGDNVKLKSDVKFDVQGRRIHNGLKNYKYRILSIRVDGMLIIECLTHCFTVKPDDVINLENFK